MANQKVTEFSALSDAELKESIVQAESDYIQTKYDHAAKGLANPTELRYMRKDIARMKTIARQRELAQYTPEQLENRSKIRARRRK